ncbi:MAG: TorF family putative porin [Asticcacaulis sp.]|nr:TorF family putative porin [Asticcacaulis sp.]
MKNMLLATTAIAAAVIAGSASATEFAGGTLSYNVAATSDYVFRGVSQTAGDPAIQGGIDYSHGLFYAGAWASNVDFADYELDLYAGIKPVYKDFTFDLGAIYYNYNDDTLDSTELKAAVSHPFYKGTIGAAYFYNTDVDDTEYYEINGSYPLTSKLSVSGAVGEQKTAGFKYTTENLGLTYAITPVFSVDVRASDTNIPEVIKPSAARLAVTLKAAF